MDNALWSRVRELIADLGRPLSVDPVSAAGVSEVQAFQTDFLDYGAYFDLAVGSPNGTALPEEARASALGHVLRRLPAGKISAAPAAIPRLSNFSIAHYTPDQLERMQRWWDFEPEHRMALSEADAVEYARSRRLVEIAMGHLRDAEPELCDEVETIVRDIVVTRPHDTNVLEYTAATSFALWGAVVLNSEHHASWVHFYRQIVHEAGHTLLHGISRDQPLVLNDLADRLPSPIRTTPRPVEGVFQAAFVSAREALALEALLKRNDKIGCFPDGEAELIWNLLELSGFAFWDCLDTLRRGASLSEFGAKILADCEAYMAANFAIEPT